MERRSKAMQLGVNSHRIRDSVLAFDRIVDNVHIETHRDLFS